MRVVCVYREESEHGGAVREFLREFTRRTGREIEVLGPDSREGAEFGRMYDVVEYPTIVAVDDRGGVLEMWRGMPLPLIDQVNYYFL